MTGDHNHWADPDQPAVYQIRIEGRLGRLWTERFEGLSASHDDGGDTLLTGPVADQAALHGVLRKVRDAGMPLVSVLRMSPRQAQAFAGGAWMKAIVYTNYGAPDVLRLADVEKPRPKDNEILIRVRAASVNPLDWHSLRGRPYIVRAGSGLRRPNYTRLGVDVAGQVEAVGKDVAQFRPGDEVYGASRGTFAEYVCTLGKALAIKPAKITFEQAAAIPVAAFTALQGLRDKGGLRPGQKVLINGASGGVGTFAVQIAKALGAEVTAVCSTGNVNQSRALGADRVIDYTREDFTRSRERYDLLFDGVGNHSLSACRRMLSPAGVYVAVAGSLSRIAKLMVLSRITRQKLLFFISSANTDDLVYLNHLMEAGKVTPVIDRCYMLDDAAEALRYLGEGHARGKIVLSLDQNHHA